MGDSFFETIVPVTPGPADAFKKAGLIILTVLSFLAGLLIHSLFSGLFLVLLVADYFLIPRLKKEYEYSYVNGELDIAAIYSKQTRKELDSVSLVSAERIAPVSSAVRDGRERNIRVTDYTSGNPGEKVCEVVTGDKEKRILLLALSDEMLQDLRRRVPGKIRTE